MLTTSCHVIGIAVVTIIVVAFRLAFFVDRAVIYYAVVQTFFFKVGSINLDKRFNFLLIKCTLDIQVRIITV